MILRKRVRILLILFFAIGMIPVFSDAEMNDCVYHGKLIVTTLIAHDLPDKTTRTTSEETATKGPFYYGIICVAAGLFIIYHGIGIIKTRLIVSFYGRKDPVKISKTLAMIIAFPSILCGVAFIYIGIRVLMLM